MVNQVPSSSKRRADQDPAAAPSSKRSRTKNSQSISGVERRITRALSKEQQKERSYEELRQIVSGEYREEGAIFGESFKRKIEEILNLGGRKESVSECIFEGLISRKDSLLLLALRSGESRQEWVKLLIDLLNKNKFSFSTLINQEGVDINSVEIQELIEEIIQDEPDLLFDLVLTCHEQSQEWQRSHFSFIDKLSLELKELHEDKQISDVKINLINVRSMELINSKEIDVEKIISMIQFSSLLNINFEEKFADKEVTKENISTLIEIAEEADSLILMNKILFFLHARSGVIVNYKTEEGFYLNVKNIEQMRSLEKYLVDKPINISYIPDKAEEVVAFTRDYGVCITSLNFKNVKGSIEQEDLVEILKYCENLQKIIICINLFRGENTSNSFKKIKTLTHLEFSKKILITVLEDSIGDLPSLTSLVLFNTSFLTEIPLTLIQLKKLETIFLGKASLSIKLQMLFIIGLMENENKENLIKQLELDECLIFKYKFLMKKFSEEEVIDLIQILKVLKIEKELKFVIDLFTVLPLEECNALSSFFLNTLFPGVEFETGQYDLFEEINKLRFVQEGIEKVIRNPSALEAVTIRPLQINSNFISSNLQCFFETALMPSPFGEEYVEYLNDLYEIGDQKFHTKIDQQLNTELGRSFLIRFRQNIASYSNLCSFLEEYFPANEPANAHFYTYFIERNIIKCAFDHPTQEPIEVLAMVAQAIKNKEYNFRGMVKYHMQNGIDEGALTKDFFSRLFGALSIKLNLKQGIPDWNPKLDSVFSDLGIVLDFLYTNSIALGEVLHDRFFVEIIKFNSRIILSEFDTISEKEFFRYFFELPKKTSLEYQYALGLQCFLKGEYEENLQRQQEFMQLACDIFEFEMPKGKLTTTKLRLFKQKLINCYYVENKKQLHTIHAILKGFMPSKNFLNWMAIKSRGLNSLKLAIHGAFDKKKLLSLIEVAIEEVEQEEVEQEEESRKIHDAILQILHSKTEQELRIFLRNVTGGPYLPQKKIEIVRKGDIIVATTHACFAIIDIPLAFDVEGVSTLFHDLCSIEYQGFNER